MTTHPFFSEQDSALLEQQIREKAYFRWIDLGRPNGDDQAHWFWSCQQAGGSSTLKPELSPSASEHFSIQNTVAAGLNDPSHRFHDRQQPQDARLDVAAGEARQRTRGRHSGGSLRPQRKASQH